MKINLLIYLFVIGLGASIQAQNSAHNKLPMVADSITPAQKSDSVASVDLIDYAVRLFSIKKTESNRISGKVNFSLFPTTTNNSGSTLVTSFNAAFCLGDINNTTVSTLYFYPYFSFSNQYGFQLSSNIWLKENKWNFTGEYFILKYPQYTWGLGGNNNDEFKTLIDYKFFRIHQKAMKGISRNMSIGLGYALDRHYDINIKNNKISNLFNNILKVDTFDTSSSGIILPATFDSRNNQIYPEKGAFYSLDYSFYTPFLGSSKAYETLFIDVRKYFPFTLKRQTVLALRSYYWSVTKNMAPYLDLPANGWEPTQGMCARGIEKNRYRSNAMLYFESEYRFGLTANGFLGGVVFANVISPSQFNTQKFKYWHAAGGAGLRFKLNKFSRTNVAFDLAMSKDYFTYYLGIGEAF